VSSTKSMYGHPLGASGSIGAVVCIKAMQEGWVPPTQGLDEADPECDLDYTANVGRSRKLTYTMANSFAFTGLNTVRGICLQYLLDASFRSDDPEVKKIFSELWNASALASELCFKLAQLLELPQPGALVTQVVLSFLGRAASHSLLPQKVVLPMMHKGLLERSRVEQDALGLCASELGSLLMQQWQLPPSIIDQVRAIDLVLLTPVEAAPRESAVAMALCYFCARVGEKLAQGEMEDLATFQLEQEHSAEFYYLQGYLRQPALARLHEFVRLPEVLSSLNTMVQAMRLRG